MPREDLKKYFWEIVHHEVTILLSRRDSKQAEHRQRRSSAAYNLLTDDLTYLKEHVHEAAQSRVPPPPAQCTGFL
jgi:hypothetical protein